MTEPIDPTLAEAAEAPAGNGLFALFGNRLAEEILARSRCRSLPAGGGLFRQGDPGDSAFVLLEGALAFLSTAAQLLHDDSIDGAALAVMARNVGNLGPFADIFGRMVREIQAKQERQQDMAMVRRIQESVLPKGLRFEGDRLAIHAVIRPMKEVGGDLYDYFMVDDRHLAVIVADVSGKGVPAALFMVMLRTVMRAVATPGMGPHQVLARANALLAEDNDACMFATVFFGLLDIEGGRLDYVNAGHIPTYLVASEGPCRELPANGAAVGIVDDARFEPRSVQLRAGDLLFLYTDGVTEAFSENHEQYGEVRLMRLLEDGRRHSVAQLVDDVMTDLDRFAAGQEQSDDITCLALAFHRPA